MGRNSRDTTCRPWRDNTGGRPSRDNTGDIGNRLRDSRVRWKKRCGNGSRCLFLVARLSLNLSLADERAIARTRHVCLPAARIIAREYAEPCHERFCVLGTPEQIHHVSFAFLSYRFHSASLRHKDQTRDTQLTSPQVRTARAQRPPRQRRNDYLRCAWRHQASGTTSAVGLILCHWTFHDVS
jgi:hypothetical protein